MPDYTGLLQALAGEQQHYASQNPWIIGGQAVLKTPVYATNETDPLQTALVQALQGLVGGFATSYGQSEVKTQSDALMGKLQAALAGAAQGGSLGKALLADPDTKVLGETAYLEEQIRKAEDARKQKELENQLILKSRYDLPQSVDAGTSKEIYGHDWVTGEPKLIKSIPTPEKLSVGEQPVNQEMLGALVEKGQIPSEVAATIKTNNDLNAVYRGQRMEGIQSRFDINRQDRQELGASASPIKDPITGATKTFSEGERSKIAETSGAAATILRNVDELKKMIKQDGRITIGDPNSKQGAAASRIFIAQRNLYNEGIRINEYIKDLDARALGVSFFAEHPLETLAQTLTGVDTERALDNFGKEVASVMKDHLLARGAKPDADKLSLYDPQGGAALRRYLGEEMPTGPYGAKVTLKDGGTATWDGKGYKRD